MCENSAVNYTDGEVVWVKLGSCWWPGEVVGLDKLPPDVLPSMRKPPIAVVKFFQEDAYEYVKNANSIYKYDCSRKTEFITKGLNLYRTKHGPMEKFPEDVVRAETATQGDIDILTRDEFQEKKKESYAGIFGDPVKKTPGSVKKGKGARGRLAEHPKTPMRKNVEKADYKVHILVQGSKTPSSDNAPLPEVTEPSTNDETESENKEVDENEMKDKEKQGNLEKPATLSTPVASSSSSSGILQCHACPFTTTRLNVLILHNKTHSVSFTPYTPSPVRKKPITKPSSKSTSETPKIPKVRKPRKEKKVTPPPVKKRAAEEETNNTETKKIKTDEEIKSSLLADWDDGDEESNDESSVIIMAGSPEVPEAAESPAIPTSADLSIIQVSTELISPVEKKFNKSPISEKAEASSDSKYEFCEDEDWPLEADGGRKIPRVKNPKRKEDAKSLSLDDDEVAREVAELLNKTTVPELPAAPEPLKIEENFPEPSIVKSPDKEKLPEKSEDKPPETQPTKAIFKTKTFFRSRHSRSQDAIGKYVAEQLNAVERMDIAESDINGSEAVSSPETRDSPPIEHVKVARLAPKIQLKKMKAEAAQLREKDKNNLDYFSDFDLNPFGELVATNAASPVSQPDIVPTPKKQEKVLQDVLYPTQEIKPVNTDIVDQIKSPTEKSKYFGDNANEAINEYLDKKSDEIQVIKHASTVQESETTTTSPDVEKDVLQELETGNDLQVSEKVDPVITVIELSETEFIQNPTDEVIQEQGCADNIQTSEISNMDHESVTNNMDNVKEHINVVPSEKEIHNVIQIPEINTTVQAPNINTILEPKVHTIISEAPALTQEQQINDIQKPNCIADTKPIPVVKGSKTYEETTEPYMNESTASAVDALLSVSREADRVTRVISDDLPEDLFEDDNKDNNGISNDVNGFNELENGVNNDRYVDKIMDPGTDVNETYDKKSTENITESISDNVLHKVDSVSLNVVEAIPSESDLQIAETLLNLPSTAIQNKTPNDHQADNCIVAVSNEASQEEIVPTEEIVIIDKNDKSLKEKELIIPHTKSLLISNNENTGLRYETEQEKSENLNAAQSLVQMSESIDHKISIEHNLGTTVNNSKDIIISDPGAFNIKQNNGLDGIKPEQKIEIKACENNNDNTNGKHVKLETSSSKLLKILEEPCTPKFTMNKPTIVKQTTISGKEKILNFDVAKSSFKGKTDSPKQKIIIRRTTPSRNTITNITEITTPDKIILSRTKNPAQDGSVQTYTIQTSAEAPPDNPIIIPQKVRKLTKPPMKLQKIKPQNSLVAPITETKVRNETTTDDSMFDINSMPIVLSEDLLTPENIEKMPIVMSDGNIITHTPNPPKLIKTKQPVENERIAITATTNKPEVKTLLMNPVTEVTKVTTPNILSKSSKLRGAKPMLVIDKTTGKQKIIMTKPAEPTVKEIKQTPTLIQAVPQNTAKAEKFFILPTQSSPRPGRTQKIVIDPQTGKAHVLVTKAAANTQQVSTTENKPISAKLIPSSTETTTTAASGTVMIITNAQGAQSRIVLTPEHEKMLFPKKQQPVVSQLQTIAHRISTNPSATSKTVITSIAPARAQNVAPVKTQTRIVPKQKSAIITSKGQLIVGGRVATTAQNIAPMPEIRQVPKRIISSDPKKLVQTIQKSSAEPLIFLQQKSGAVMQLTTAQFEHLQRTGQIVQKAPAQPVQENKVIVQKTITVPSNESVGTILHKPRARKALAESPAPLKRLKQEVAIAPAIASPVPSLSPLSNTSSIVPCISNTVSVSTTSAYSEFENFEELLPSTAIARQHEPIVTPVITPVVEQQAQVAPPPGPISDGQLIAVPGEHFGGPPGSFYLCMEENGTFTPIDHRPLVLENNQLVPMPEPLPVIGTQPERRDILEAALANSDVFHADTPRDEAPDFRDLNANVSVHCRVSETSTILNQAPIMTPVEVPTKVDSETAVSSNLEDGLAVIGITAHTVPTSLELPITVTDPRIAPKMTDPLSSTSPYTTTSLLPSPSTEMTFATTEETIVPMGGPISMPLLTDDESVGKSMPILTDEVAERTVSSVDSAVGSPSSIDVRESENEDSSQWTRRLLTPGSDTSEASAEIPLQPTIQLSVSELSRHS